MKRHAHFFTLHRLPLFNGSFFVVGRCGVGASRRNRPLWTFSSTGVQKNTLLVHRDSPVLAAGLVWTVRLRPVAVRRSSLFSCNALQEC